MTQVTFSLIGPLDVRCSGEPIILRAARQRTLLAALLVRANQPVSRQTLCLAVWGERLSDRAEVTLRSYVMRLRNALGPSVSGRLSVQPSGYQLRLEPDDELDLLRLQVCLRQGNAAARHGDWSRSLREYRAGIALWRGEPLCDVPSESLRLTVLPTLTELRTQLWEGLYSAAINLGRVADWVVPLQRLITEEPVSERLSMLLMSALAQCDRRIDALAEFRRLRHALISEQGVEPCASVQELHHRLLRDQARPDRAETVEGDAAGADARRPAIVPRQLPHGGSVLAGRIRELDELLGHLAGDPAEADTAKAGMGRVDMASAPVVAIAGMPGIGKTELAVAIAHRAVSQYPDGQLYAELRADQTNRIMARFLRSLGVGRLALARDAEERTAQYRSMLADRRMLILLDGASDAEQVRPLIPGGESCLTLVTSWWSMSQLTEARCVALGELADADATRALAALLGEARVTAEPSATASIVAACAGLPLALRIVAARLAARPGWPLGYLAALLADEESRLDELSYGRLSVRASLAEAYRLLTVSTRPAGRVSAAARRPITPAIAFRLLGAWRRVTFSAAEAAAHIGRPLTEVTPALEALVDMHLLGSPGPGSYRLHPLVRLFAIELANTGAGQYLTVRSRYG